MPCLHTESPVRNNTDPETPPHPAPETTQRSRRKKKEERQRGRLLPSLWSLQTKYGQKDFEGGMDNHTVESWSDHHADPARSPRRSCRENGGFVKMWVQMHPKLSVLLPGRRRDSHPPCGSSWRLAPPAVQERSWLCLSVNHFEDFDGGRLLRSLLFPESPVIQQNHQPRVGASPCSAGPCEVGKCCDWMMGLLGGGVSHLKWQEICHKVLVHVREVVAAEHCCLAMTTTDEAGGQVLGTLFQTATAQNHTHSEWERCIMGYVVSTGCPLNISDAQKETRFHPGVDEPSACRPESILSVPIKNQQAEVIAVVLAVNKVGAVSFFSKQDEKVLTSHSTLLGVFLENHQLTERCEQESHHNQVLVKMVQLLKTHHRCLETVLSKLCGVVLQASEAKLCRVVLSDETDRECFSRVVCAERDHCSGLTHYTERELDADDLSYVSAVRARNSVGVTHLAAGVKSLICAPVKDPRRNLVLGVCELQKASAGSDEGSGFSRVDERLLQSLAEYCALALQIYSFQQAAERTSTKLAITEEVLSYHMAAPVEEAEALEKCTVPSARSLGLMDFSFTDADLSLAASTQAAVRMFLDLHLLQTFNMEYKVQPTSSTSSRSLYPTNYTPQSLGSRSLWWTS